MSPSQWHHRHSMTPQITDNSIICSTDCLGKQQQKTPVPDGFSAQSARNAESVSMSWRVIMRWVKENNFLRKCSLPSRASHQLSFHHAAGIIDCKKAWRWKHIFLMDNEIVLCCKELFNSSIRPISIQGRPRNVVKSYHLPLKPWGIFVYRNAIMLTDITQNLWS